MSVLDRKTKIEYLLGTAGQYLKQTTNIMKHLKTQLLSTSLNINDFQTVGMGHDTHFNV